jgi:hypothetical protein
VPFGVFFSVSVAVRKVFGGGNGEFHEHSAIFKSAYFGVFAEVADEHDFI